MTPAIDEIEGFLRGRFDDVHEVVQLKGGAWSSAFTFVSSGRELVLRVGRHGEDFAKEAVAATWNVAGLPVPEVLARGEAFDQHYIVTQRHHGTALAELAAGRVRGAVEALFDVLVTVRQVSLPGTGYGIWVAPDCDAPARSWRDFVCGVAERDETRLVDWRRKLALNPAASDAFHRGCAALQRRGGDLPDTRGVVHDDLLLNHLIGPDGTVTAVFDWGNALAGDPLYDVAWITYSIPWFPAIERRHVLGLARERFPDDDLDMLHPLYELHIAIGSLQYQAFMGDGPALAATTSWIERALGGAGRR